jgi:hypothetical protein
MITESEMYWLTRCDNICVMFTLVLVAAVFTMFVTGFILLLIQPEPDDTEDLKRRALARRLFIISSLLAVMAASSCRQPKKWRR